MQYCGRNNYLYIFVITALVAVIHVTDKLALSMDYRDRPGNDGVG